MNYGGGGDFVPEGAKSPSLRPCAREKRRVDHPVERSPDWSRVLLRKGAPPDNRNRGEKLEASHVTTTPVARTYWSKRMRTLRDRVIENDREETLGWMIRPFYYDGRRRWDGCLDTFTMTGGDVGMIL